MIYFRVIFTVLRSNFFKCLFVFICFLGIIYGLENRKQITNKFLKQNSSAVKLSFITDEITKDVEIKNKLMVLPGVKKVDVIKDAELRNNIKTLFKDIEFDSILNEADVSHYKYVLTFDSNISEKSIKLIKSFVIKILSNKELVFSKVKGLKHPHEEKKASRSNFIIFYSIFGLISLIFFSLVFNLNMSLKKISYLFQRFQRSDNVAVKSGVILFLVQAFVGYIIFYVLLATSAAISIICVSSIIILFLILFNIKEYRWN